MKILKEEQIREEVAISIAKKMMTAARTAPKGRGVDNVEMALLTKPEIEEISAKTKEFMKEFQWPPFFERDANNILSAQALILIGTKIEPLNLSPCGMCGFANCEEKLKHPNNPCVFNTGDLGIAVGSAVSVAMDNRVDNRIMYTIGQTALKLKLLGEDVKIAYAIPISISSKSPFFDRK